MINYFVYLPHSAIYKKYIVGVCGKVNMLQRKNGLDNELKVHPSSEIT